MYTRYLSLLTLRPEHASFYERRGSVDALAAQVFGYRSLPFGKAEANEVGGALIREFGAEVIARVPGFNAKGIVGRHYAANGYDAVAIPCRNEYGQIVGMVRHMTATSGAKDEKKYMNFVGAQDLYTVAAHIETPDSGGDVWVVEGIHKSHVSCLAGRLRVVGLPGHRLREFAERATAALLPDRVILALDVDRGSNQRVGDDHADALRKLHTGPWQVAVADWPKDHGNGLDDVLTAGYLPAIREVEPEPPTAAPAVVRMPAPATGRSLAAGRNQEWYAARQNGAFQARKGNLASFDRLEEAKFPAGRPIINTADPSWALSKADLVTVMESAIGDRTGSDILLKRLRSCGWTAGLECVSHGEQARTKCTCKLPVHGGCPTITTAKVRLSTLPDLEGEAGYRSIWFSMPLRMGPRHGWRRQFTKALEAWAAWVHLVCKRKTWSGKVLSRAAAFHLDPVESLVQLRLHLREDAHGEADELVEEVCKTFGALPTGDNRTQSGETAILQAMEDSSGGLLGMSELDTQLFEAFWDAIRPPQYVRELDKAEAEAEAEKQGGDKNKRKVRSVKLFQGYAALYQAIKKRQKEEPLKCPLCGGKLHAVPHPSGTEEPQPAPAHRPRAAANRPTPWIGPYLRSVRR